MRPAEPSAGMDWGELIDEDVVRALLSQDIARYARPIREALIVFLTGLPQAAQRDILAAQAALPETSEITEWIGAMARQCPVLHKLGQMLARDRRLDPRLRGELAKLEALPPSVHRETLRGALRDEIGDLERLGVELDAAAIAEASVAVVIGYRDQGSGGVFKVLKPGVEERLEIELEQLAQVGVYLDERCEELAIPRFGYEAVFEQVRDKLLDEVRLSVEQHHLGRAARQFERYAGVKVPALRPYCTPRVTAMERIAGSKVTDLGPGNSAERLRLASLIADALLARPIFSTTEDVLFHGDPHAGNLFCTPAGQLAILDWSLAGTLRAHQREAIVHILIGAILLDEQRVSEMLARVSESTMPDPARLVPIVRQHLQPIRAGRLPDFQWVVRLMDDAFAGAGLRASRDLILLRKSLQTLEGVIADLAPGNRSIESAFFIDWIQHLAAEWPQRLASDFDSRAFATRLSNLDLTQLMLSLPLVTTRFWLGQTRPDRGGAQARRRAGGDGGDGAL